MPRKHINAGPRLEFETGPGAQAPYADFPSPLGRPKWTFTPGTASTRTRAAR